MGLGGVEVVHKDAVFLHSESESSFESGFTRLVPRGGSRVAAGMLSLSEYRTVVGDEVCGRAEDMEARGCWGNGEDVLGIGEDGGKIWDEARGWMAQ